MAIKYQQVSYQEVIDGVSIEGDDYGIAKQSITGYRKDAFLHNPFLEDYSKCMILLARADEVVCGKRMMLPSKLKAGEEIINCVAGSNYYVHPSFRQYGIGGAMITSAMKKSNVFLLSAGCSKDSLKIYKAMNGGILEFPVMVLPRILCKEKDCTSLKAFGKTVINAINNGISQIKSKRLKSHSVKLREKFIIKQNKTIPEWASDMVLNDSHKYMELHNQEWLQWGLDYNFNDSNSEKESQSFWEVWMGDTPVGFFLITNRVRHGFVYTSVAEWQSSNEKILSEIDIYTLASDVCNDDSDYFKVATSNQQVVSYLSNYGFRQNGKANIVFKDLTKRFEDINDPTLWRIRLGYADFLLS